VKLIEVLQPLLENKVDHITRNQWLKIFVSAYTDGSLNTNVSGTDLALGGLRPVYLVDILKSSGERDVSITSYSLKRMTVDHIRDYDSRRIRKSVGELQYVISNNLKRVTSLTLEDTIRKYAYQVVQFMADNISKKHLQWVVNRYIEDDFRLMEDYEMVQNTLEVYDKVRLETDIPQLTKGISYQYLFHEIVKFIDAEEQELRDVREKRLVADGELEIPFYQDKSEYVAIPKTFKASKHLSKPNGWCTQHENWFDTYTKDGVLYFFRHRGKPYLVHFESRQFMGKANQPFDVGSMIESSPAFQWIINQRKKEVENMQTGNPSAVAHFMVRNGYTNDKSEYVAIPKTFKASKHLSKPNGWCTQYKNWFEDYTKDGRVLYYFRHQGKPHLVHFESGQFMKKGNRPFDLKSVRESSPAFQWIIGQKKKEVENMQDDDPSSAAYEMVRDGFAELEWAMKVIENDKTGDSSDAAYLMVRDGYTEPEWAMRIIQNAKTGNPSGVAYMMVVDGYTEPEWAMKVIENAKTGNPSGVAYWMVRDGHTNDTEWAMKVIENAKTGNPSGGAYAMVRDGHTKDTEWAMKVIENATTGDPSYVAYRMVRDGHAPQEWYDRNFG